MNSHNIKFAQAGERNALSEIGDGSAKLINVCKNAKSFTSSSVATIKSKQCMCYFHPILAIFVLFLLSVKTEAVVLDSLSNTFTYAIHFIHTVTVDTPR